MSAIFFIILIDQLLCLFKFHFSFLRTQFKASFDFLTSTDKVSDFSRINHIDEQTTPTMRNLFQQSITTKMILINLQLWIRGEKILCHKIFFAVLLIVTLRVIEIDGALKRD